MTINVPNRQPVFNNGMTAFTPVKVAMNSVLNIPIPAFSDPDLTIPNIKIEETAAVKVAASFPTKSALKIAPTTFAEVGLHST